MPQPALPIRSAVRLLALALLVLAAMPGVEARAQAATAATLLPPERESETRVLPVWSNSSGRVEALLLLDPDESRRSANALDRIINPARPDLGLGARLTLDGGSRVQGSMQFETDGLALLCDDRHGLTRALGALGEHCLLAKLGSDDPLLAGSPRGATLGLDWRAAGGEFDLSFGLSWLSFEAHPQPWLGEAGQASPMGNPESLDLISAWARQYDSRQLRLNGLIALGPQARLLLGGDLGHSRLRSLSGTDVEWESAALSLGLGYGNFSGQLTGRLVELPQGTAPWRSLDIGLSWRTPWHGELSVGAKNVLGNPDTSRWPLSDLPPLEDPSARVPYVRYKQDL